MYYSCAIVAIACDCCFTITVMQLIAYYIFKRKLNISIILQCISINEEVFVYHAIIILLLYTYNRNITSKTYKINYIHYE